MGEGRTDDKKGKMSIFAFPEVKGSRRGKERGEVGRGEDRLRERMDEKKIRLREREREINKERQYIKRRESYKTK